MKQPENELNWISECKGFVGGLTLTFAAATASLIYVDLLDKYAQENTKIIPSTIINENTRSQNAEQLHALEAAIKENPFLYKPIIQRLEFEGYEIGFGNVETMYIGFENGQKTIILPQHKDAAEHLNQLDSYHKEIIRTKGGWITRNDGFHLIK